MYNTFTDRLYGQFSWLMSVSISLFCFGALNGLLFTSGRLNFVAAREGQLPTLLATIYLERLTPVPTILLYCLLSLIMLIVSDLFTLINYVSFVKWLSIGSSIIVFLLVCTFILILPIFHKPKVLLTGMDIVLSGIPIYLIGITWNKKPDVYKQKYSIYPYPID
ncbi:hypothetical protein MN116_007723 [Schistosoma mekongi]|uniref:Uncharacterized protein n=1 Tax=Schistosoma mekongi TaxID=38744 RepID=A0AAE1Z7H6_SCHME|nr:hypothetical protein MN116_007723 [Schistosoma mekongi]